MRIIACNSGMGHNEFFVALQLSGKNFLVIGANVEHEQIGNRIELEFYEIRDSRQMTLDEAREFMDASLFQYLAFSEEKAKQDEERANEAHFYVAQHVFNAPELNVRKLLKQWNLSRYFETGGLYQVTCHKDRAAGIVKQFREMKIPAGLSNSDVSV